MTGSVAPRSHGPLRIGVLWRGDASSPAPAPESTRLRAIFGALTEQGADSIPIVFADDAAERIGEQLPGFDGVLVWVDPIMDGVNRAVLDGVLRRAADEGVYVSAHPDVVLAMGTKDVLYRTRGMSWGTDVRRYASLADLAERLPGSLDSGPRVLKQLRGNGGNGVWRVERVSGGDVHVLHGLRGAAVETMAFAELVRRLGPYFSNGGGMIDQAFQSRLGEGMVRCYVARDRVAGFGQQMVTALLAPSEDGAAPPPPPPRVYFGPEQAEYQPLRVRMESEWLPALLGTLELRAEDLPAIWDADLLHGAGIAAGETDFVLCEINVSSVFPIPDEAAALLAEVAIRGSAAARANRPA